MSTIGTIELIATIDTSQYLKGANQIDKANSDLEDSGVRSSSKLSDAFSTVAKVGLAAIAAAAVAVTAVIVKNFSSAIKRVDTLNNSARTFENMGFTASAVDSAMKALDKSIRGLPTSLDEAVRGVQMIAASTNDVGKAQKIFSSLNNAIIGFGGTSADVTNAVLQMSQAFAGGRIDAQTWNSMLNSNLGPALNAIARQMGITTKKLKEGLSDGTISVEKFQAALIDMNEKGGGGMKSFQQISKDATSGIGTGWQNMQTAITRGIASIINVIGSTKISEAITRVGTVFEKTLKVISGFIKLVFSGNFDGKLFGGVFDEGSPVIRNIQALRQALLDFTDTVETGAHNARLAIKAFFEALKGNGITSKGFVGAAEQIGVVLRQLYNEVLKPMSEFVAKQFTNAWKDLTSAFSDLKKQIDPFIPDMEKFAKVIGITLVVAIGLAVGAIVIMVEAVSLVATVVARLVGWTVKAASKLADFGKSVRDTMKSVNDSIGNFVKSTINSIKNGFNSVIDFLKEWGKTILATVLAPFALALGVFFTFKDAIAGIFKAIWQSIVTIMSPVAQFFAGIFSSAWNNVVQNWQTASTFFQTVWDGITGVFSTVATWFGDIFAKAWENIKNNFSSAKDFFQGIWNGIASVFRGVGTTVGDAIGGAFKAVVNSVIGFAQNSINGFIKAINGAIGLINHIPGVKIGSIPELNIPRLATGGIISSPTLAMVGEGKEPEAVIPLSKLDKILKDNGGSSSGGVNITVNLDGIMARSTADLRDVAKQLVGAINDELAAKQHPLIGGGAI